MPNKIELQEFPSCCGILLLKNFFKNEPLLVKGVGRDIPIDGDKPVWDDWIRAGYAPETLGVWNKEQLRENLEMYQQRVKKYLDEFLKTWVGKKSYGMIVLNEREDNLIRDILLDAGFEVLVPMTRNPTGTKIVTYIRYLLPKEEKKVESVLAPSLTQRVA